MNARTIKNKIIEQGKISLDDIIIHKDGNEYLVSLSSGLNDTERFQMTGPEVNKYRRDYAEKLDGLAELFNAEKLTYGIVINKLDAQK